MNAQAVVVLSTFFFSMLWLTVDEKSETPPSPIVSVKTFGATGNSKVDDRPAVQAAIDSLKGGGTVCFPSGTFLIDSYITSRSGDNYNLVTSHDDISLEPCQGVPPGTVTIIQGPNGWGTRTRPAYGPIAVFNSQFFLASKIGQNGYQNLMQNGGYYAVTSPISSGTTSISFADPTKARLFAAGDWIAIALTTDQKVIEPLEINQVVSVNSTSGVVSVRWPQTETYSTGFAANVTKMVRSHISISGLTIQGVSPVFLNDLFGITYSNCRLIADTTYVGPGRGHYIFANGVRHMLFNDNVVSDYPTGQIANLGGTELPQNNSIDIVIEHNTFLTPIGVGEYPEHWEIKHNTIKIAGTPRTGLSFQGYDMLFEGNNVTSSAILPDSLYNDFSSAPNPYRWLFGAQKIRNNQFTAAGGRSVIRISAPDTELSNNIIVGGPGQHGIFLETSDRPHGNSPTGTTVPTNLISGNIVHCSKTAELGCVLLSGPTTDKVTFKENSISGDANSKFGIWVKSKSSSPSSKMKGNRVEGFDSKEQVVH